MSDPDKSDEGVQGANSPTNEKIQNLEDSERTHKPEVSERKNKRGFTMFQWIMLGAAVATILIMVSALPDAQNCTKISQAIESGQLEKAVGMLAEKGVYIGGSGFAGDTGKINITSVK